MTAENQRLLLMGQLVSVAELRRRCRSGDADAQNLVFEQLRADMELGDTQSLGLQAVTLVWKKPITTWVRANFFEGDGSAADVVWNETLIRVAMRWEQFDQDRSRFSTWLFNQARYAALDELRLRRRMKKADASELVTPSWEDTLPSPLSNHEKVALRRAMRRLSDTERTLLLARHVREEDYDSLFRQLGGVIKREHIRIYLSRATIRLKRFYEQELTRR